MVVAAHPPSPAVSYRRREPELGDLHRIVRSWFPAAEALIRERLGEDVHLPRFVHRAVEKYLDCGQLSKGFIRVRCKDCGDDRLVAFSCKVRGLCLSCDGRRMADEGAHLVDHVLPKAPYRQWVLTLPYALRYRLAWDQSLRDAVLRIFTSEVDRFYVRGAEADGVTGAKAGGISVLHRFDSALKSDVHWHLLFADGTWAPATIRPHGRIGTPKALRLVSRFWYSWRQQLTGLADAGFRAIAIDLRGYGGSDKAAPIPAIDLGGLSSAGIFFDANAYLCGGRRQVIAVILQASEVARTLRHVKLWRENGDRDDSDVVAICGPPGDLVPAEDQPADDWDGWDEPPPLDCAARRQQAGSELRRSTGSGAQRRKLALGESGAFNAPNSGRFWRLTGAGSRAHCLAAVLPEGPVAGNGRILVAQRRRYWRRFALAAPIRRRLPS